jgi:HSP20 family protein
MTLLPVKKQEAPRRELVRFHNEIDDLFQNFFGDYGMPISGLSRWPAIDIANQENEYVVKVEVPGCKAEDIEISVNGNMLTISGEKKGEKEVKEKGYYHVERSFGSFRRDLSLAGDVDTSKIEAECKEGVLTVRLPKSEKAKTAKIKVKS